MDMNKRQKKTAANIIIVGLILCGVVWIASLFVHVGGEYSNNAQVRQNIAVVSSRVQGFIKEVKFDEFQYVHKGDTLVIIEDSEFRLRLAQAQSDYRELEIQFENASAEYNRHKNLLAKEAVTRQQFDAVKTKYESLKAKLENTQTKEGKQNIGIANAAVDLAALNLSYTVILAPCDGYTSDKTIQEGELVMPGQILLSVVSDEQKWLIANYRETQLKNIKIGSKVNIKIDAFPNIKFKGEVAAISNATGEQYSPNSHDNSVGNFVKTEQRIPVKIVFTADNDPKILARLSSGMNAECKVKK